jgi:hypothetical protein
MARMGSVIGVADRSRSRAAPAQPTVASLTATKFARHPWRPRIVEVKRIGVRSECRLDNGVVSVICGDAERRNLSRSA